LIKVVGIYAVAVMDDESVSFVTAHALAKLLKGPFGGRMLSNVIQRWAGSAGR
jgi:hypothetical protein